MPLTAFQSRIAKLLCVNRRPDSYIAGGAAMHFAPNSIRYSQDIDFFHDSEQLVAEAFRKDSDVLRAHDIDLRVEMHQPGYIRAIVGTERDMTKIEWAHDSAWRFMPTYFVEDQGFLLHPVDLALNKVLALAGRDEPRDFLDVMHAHATILPLAGLVWAAPGKDPGFTPHSLLELLRRKGKYRPDDFRRLRLNIELNVTDMKQRWLAALDEAPSILSRLPSDDVGALYFDASCDGFVVPDTPLPTHVLPHFASEGGVLPKLIPQSEESRR